MNRRDYGTCKRPRNFDMFEKKRSKCKYAIRNKYFHFQRKKITENLKFDNQSSIYLTVMNLLLLQNHKLFISE